MNKLNRRNSLILMIMGILTISISQIASHYITMPDVAKGLSIGAGIGMLLFALIFRKFKTSY